LGNGATLDELKWKLGVRSQKQINNLLSFLQNNVSSGILTCDQRKAGAVRVKAPIVSPPLERIFLEVTSKCNLHCVHCYLSAGAAPDEKLELTKDDIIRIIRRADELGAYRLDFTGGEIFVREDMHEVLGAACEAFMIVNIFTNGTLLDEKRCAFLASLGNISTAYISLDDLDEAAHDAFRGSNGAFQRTIKGIKLLRDNGVRIVLNITITKRNISKIHEIVDFAKNLGIGYRIAPIIYVGRGESLKDNDVSEDEAAAKIKSVFNIKEKSFRASELDKSNLFGCGVGHKMLFIKSSGEICLCPTLTSRENPMFELGQIATHDIGDIWENSEMLSFFRGTHCRRMDCEHLSECRGGCRSRAFLKSGDLFAEDTITCAIFGVKKRDNKDRFMSTRQENEMLFTKGGMRFFLTKHLPVALLPESRTVFLTNELIELLRFCRNGATVAAATQYLEETFPNVNAMRIINHMIKENLLVRERPPGMWRGNTFGASLIDEKEYQAVQKTLESKRLFRYQEIDLEYLDSSMRSPCVEFERQLASMIKVHYCVALNSGTSALECAMRALGIEPGQKVIVPASAYIGTVAAVLNIGAIPTICDIDESLMLSPEAAEKCITEETRAILCVHVRGIAAKISELSDLARRKGLFLIEDCAQALGTTYGGKPVGSFGDVGCFSFHQHKIITCGEGGAITTNHEDVYKRILILSDASRLFAHHDMLPGIPGHNYRMSEIHAAIGIAQFKRLPAIIEHLRNIYRILAGRISVVPGLALQDIPDPDGAVPQSINLMATSSEKAQALSNELLKYGIPASVTFHPKIINHDVYAYWPYVLERIGAVKRWVPDSDAVLQLCPSTLELLSKTIGFPLGVKITPLDAKMASDAIVRAWELIEASDLK
jgi:8-amino-3,8-dideoxy-alpha-D-manno-octulosonate transaminase